jgi:hypothetical protein
VKIKVIWGPFDNGDGAFKDSAYFDRMAILELPDGSRIEEVRGRFYAKSMAVYGEDQERVIGRYHESGILKDQTCYMLCSANIKKTAQVLTTPYQRSWEQ